ncbi:hypothetical protein [Antarctobacter heliothermus]|nr:hypothetical protein [Antarctobacter heliothermus]
MDPFLQRHLDLCQRSFEDMLRDGSWPWLDSPNSEDLVESKDNSHDL